MIKTFKVKLIQNNNLNDRVKLFRFEVLDNFSFLFTPGQFVVLYLKTESGEIIKRQYSIANLGDDNSFLDLAVTLVENGVGTNCLCRLEIGDIIESGLPRGKFSFQENKPARHILVGTGTGVVPYRSMLSSIEQYLQHSQNACIVLQGVKYRCDAIFEEDFLRLCVYKNFDFKLCLSRERQLGDKRSYEEYGYVQDYFSNINLNPQTDIVYLCGNPHMIEDIEVLLTNIGFVPEQIVMERYFSSKK